MALTAEGPLALVCPVRDESEVSGTCILRTSLEVTTAIMEGDPGVAIGIFTCELHPCRGFPGGSLPG